MEYKDAIIYLGLIMIFIGIVMIIISLVIQTPTPSGSHNMTSSGGNVSGGIGGCIIIGPIPICFGTGTPGFQTSIMMLAIILTIIVLILFFVLPLIISKRIIEQNTL